MKDFAHKPIKSKHWSNRARDISENIIIIMFVAFVITMVIKAAIQ